MGKKLILVILTLIIIATAFCLITWSERKKTMIRMCHDSRLINNVRQLSLVLEFYRDDEKGYPQSSAPDFPIKLVEKYDEKLADFGFGYEKLAEIDLKGNKYCYYNWVDNNSDNKKVCFYAYSEFNNTYYAASHRGYYECEDEIPTLDDCCFPSP